MYRRGYISQKSSIILFFFLINTLHCNSQLFCGFISAKCPDSVLDLFPRKLLQILLQWSQLSSGHVYLSESDQWKVMPYRLGFYSSVEERAFIVTLYNVRIWIIRWCIHLFFFLFLFGQNFTNIIQINIKHMYFKYMIIIIQNDDKYSILETENWALLQKGNWRLQYPFEMA